MCAGHQGESRPGLGAANYGNGDIRAHVAPRRHFDQSGNGLPGDCYRGSHGERWLLCRGRHAQNATQKNQCQSLAHTRLLQTTLDSRQSITPPVDAANSHSATRSRLSPYGLIIFSENAGITLSKIRSAKPLSNGACPCNHRKNKGPLSASISSSVSVPRFNCPAP